MSAEKTCERSFAQLMLEGKTKAALCLLCNKDTGCPLSLDDIIDTGTAEGRYVLDILDEKHPPAEPAYPESTVSEMPEPVHHAIFDAMDACFIRHVALCTEGAAGPSLMACRLITLSKNPGVHPIGIGETARRIMAKAVLSVIR